MAPTTRRGPNTPPNNMTPESVQAMIDQALVRNSTNGDGSHSSHEDNRRNVQTARPCFYADFMKCQPLNFKVTKGVVGLTRWIKKMESVFNISGCAIENQVKFATCTLLGFDLVATWPSSVSSQIRYLGPESYSMRLFRQHFKCLLILDGQLGNYPKLKWFVLNVESKKFHGRLFLKLKHKDGGKLGKCTTAGCYGVGMLNKKGNAHSRKPRTPRLCHGSFLGYIIAKKEEEKSKERQSKGAYQISGDFLKCFRGLAGSSSTGFDPVDILDLLNAMGKPPAAI
ncbi:hypothetical protein Tco_0010009 [Tanacetum coccineum]